MNGVDIRLLKCNRERGEWRWIQGLLVLPAPGGGAKTRRTRSKDLLENGSCIYGELGDNGKLNWEGRVDWMVIPSAIKC